MKLLKCLSMILITYVVCGLGSVLAATNKTGTVNYLSVRHESGGKVVKFKLSDNSCPGPNHYYVLQATHGAFFEAYSLLLSAKMANKEVVVTSTSCPGNNYVYLNGQGHYISFQ